MKVPPCQRCILLCQARNRKNFSNEWSIAISFRVLYSIDKKSVEASLILAMDVCLNVGKGLRNWVQKLHVNLYVFARITKMCSILTLQTAIETFYEICYIGKISCCVFKHSSEQQINSLFSIRKPIAGS